MTRAEFLKTLMSFLFGTLFGPLVARRVYEHWQWQAMPGWWSEYLPLGNGDIISREMLKQAMESFSAPYKHQVTFLHFDGQVFSEEEGRRYINDWVLNHGEGED